MPVTYTVMVREGLIAIGGDLIGIAIGMLRPAA